MISMPDSYSKRYPSAQTGYGSHLYCNRFLSNGLSNMQSNFRRNEINKLQRPTPRSMRTIRSKIYERSGVEEAESCTGNQNQPACTAEKENIEDGIGDASDVDSNKEEECVAGIETSSFDFSQAFSDLSSYSSDISGELYRLATASPRPCVYNINNNGINNNHLKEPVSRTKWVDSFVKSGNADREEHSQSKPQMSSTRTEMVYESLEPEKLKTVVNALVQDLGPGSSIELQRNAAAELRFLAKHKMENRVMIGGAGAIKPLVSLLHSTDPQTQENAVTALLNVSLCETNKMEITRAAAIEPLVHVLKTGTSTAKQNAACTLLSLSLIDDNKITIGAAGAIPPLVALLINGSSRGKKDAATTLYTLSSLHQNKDRAIRAGAVKPLVDLMADPSSGMVDKAVIVLSNLASVFDGKSAIVQDGGIPVLVEVIETGSQKAKEFATATLLQLCTDSYLYRTLVSREGAIPPLVALSETGNARTKQKAATLLQYLREPRQRSLREQL